MSTVNDEKVLNAILNPNTPFDEDIKQENASRYDEASEEIRDAKCLELKGVKAAESNDINLSIEFFKQAIETAPAWASAYNNRAQALRLSGDIDALTADELATQHNKQKKELTNKIQALKKSITKGDKKKKKEVDAQIAQLENEFKNRCTLELSQLSVSTKESVEESEPTTESSTVSTVKLSKAQKKRVKKEQEQKLRQEQIAFQDVENLKGPTHIELTKIKAKLAKNNLEIKEVSSDGNCMFYALSDQLKEQLGVDRSFKELRLLTSEYMLKNPGEFQPYLCSEETGDPFTEEEYVEYCEKIKECLAPVWGSMTELKALADLLKVRIEVVQAEGSEILIGTCDDEEKRLIVTYHRHMFGSGEHYNSTRLMPSDDF